MMKHKSIATDEAEDGTAWTTQIIVYHEPSNTEADVKRYLTEEPNHYDLDGTRCKHEHDCCGRWYQSVATFDRDPNGTSTLVKQRHRQNV